MNFRGPFNDDVNEKDCSYKLSNKKPRNKAHDLNLIPCDSLGVK